ncbi:MULTISPECIES: hypothetical protein [Catenuloplanes]|uniref:Uncharacterized protein n=1 Tax=Catenuloplanes niger TaxID=587534 RepID=A0AAE4CUF6_9ACTN|nr:hypothetical protein [Catenuloplanes niger]MDR7323353.1 hypothetical protein [Catenuloplanes niger]
MTPTGVAVLLILALAIDYTSAGPASLRDRVAFLMAIPAIREGWNGSDADLWLTDRLTGVIQSALDMQGNAYIAGASASLLLGVAVFGVWLYGMACVVPDIKITQKYAGRFVTTQFPTTDMYRINTRLWLIAIALGLFAELPGGNAGAITAGSVDWLAGFFAPLPGWIFGV